jgi:TolB-like protein
MSKPIRIVAALCFTLSCVLAAAQSAQPRVTVLPFEGVAVEGQDVLALTLFFETALQNTGRCQIMEQTEVDKILKAHQYVLADFNDPDKAVEIGRLIPADHIVLGTVGILGGRHYVNVKMIDLRTGAIVGARNATADSLEELSALLPAVAEQMTGAPPSPAPAPAAPPAAPPTAAVPPLVIREASLLFFESGPDIPAFGQRVFASVFDTRYTHFINWELTLQFDQVSTEMTVPVEVRYLRYDGSVHTTQSMQFNIGAGWTWGACWKGWGAATPNNWPPGTYTVEAYVSSRRVTSASFIVR